jgi:sugar (pentulose or hexulose) kinase
MRRGDAVIGLDCGTSSAKALALDGEGNLLGSGKAGISLSNPAPSRYEQDPEDWWTASCAAVRDAARAVGPERVVALSISHQRETFVPVDEEGRALRPAILWMDGRAGDLLPGLRGKLGDEAFRNMTGKALSGNLTFAKIAWLARKEPELYKRTAAFLDVHAYLALRLTGRAVTGWGSADPTGMFDMGKVAWSNSILSSIDLDSSLLPDALAPGKPIGILTDEAASACGLKSGVLLVTGLGDGQAAGLGCGVVGSGESYLSLGTSVVSGTYSPSFIADRAFRTSFGGVPGSYFLETVILCGAQSLSWFMATFGSGMTEADISSEAARLRLGSEGIVFLPYLNAAMNPYWDEGATGVLAGLQSGHGRAHIYRAILEGIAFEQRLHTEGVETALSRAGAEDVRIERYVVGGGGSTNELWMKIIADVTGRRLHRARSEEAAALGAGILAAGASGIHMDVASATRAMAGRNESAILPDPEAHEAYTRIYEEAYVGIYPSLIKGRASKRS